MDYKDYEKLHKKKKDQKKEGLLKNPVQEISTELITNNDLLQEKVAVDNANRDFNITNDEVKDDSADTVEVVPKTTLNSDTSNLTAKSPILTKDIPEKYMENAAKLFEKIDLDSYRGGLYTLDGEQYTYDELIKILTILYGKAQKLKNLKLEGKDLNFVKSLHERNLKKYVKNKAAFKLVHASFNWWNLNE